MTTMDSTRPAGAATKFSTAREALGRVNALIEKTSNAQHKAWLTTYRDHWWNEVIGDVDGVMATMSRGPIRYVFDGHPFMTPEGGLSSVDTYEATRGMYEGVVAMGIRMAGSMDEETIYFTENGLANHSILSAVYPGIYLTKHSEPVDIEALYVVRWPNITIVPFDESGLMAGELIYNGAPILVRKIDRSQVDCLIDGPLPA